jgi:hypothetical protein
MTDLQLSLIIVGIIIVFGVIFYNKWQEYQAKKKMVSAFSFSSQEDVLMKEKNASLEEGQEDEPRHEPVLNPIDLENLSSTQVAKEEGEKEEPSLTEPQEPPAVSREELPVDEFIDCLMTIGLEIPVRGEEALFVLHNLTAVNGKEVHFIGLRRSGEWDEVRAGCMYIELRVALRLANRNSALNELEYSQFVTRLRDIADQLGGELDVPEMSQVVLTARELHRFLTAHDALLGVNVVPRAALWPWEQLHMVLKDQGFEVRGDNKFMMPDGDGGVLFTLGVEGNKSAGTVAKLTLLLAVPCVAPLRDAFGAMISSAKVLAAELEGVVVDDTNMVLSENAILEISGQVSAFYEEMDKAEIPAGSSRALRLFC